MSDRSANSQGGRTGGREVACGREGGQKGGRERGIVREESTFTHLFILIEESTFRVLYRARFTTRMQPEPEAGNTNLKTRYPHTSFSIEILTQHAIKSSRKSGRFTSVV